MGLPDHAEHVNLNGVAIALGHQLSMFGARFAGTAALGLINAPLCVAVGKDIALTMKLR